MKIKYKILLPIIAAFTMIGGSVAYSNGMQGTNSQAQVPASDYCVNLAQQLGGLAIPNGDVCDVVVVRKTPQIEGRDGMNLNKFTLMNSVLEFTKTGMPRGEAYVMGDFALLETELNRV